MRRRFPSSSGPPKNQLIDSSEIHCIVGENGILGGGGFGVVKAGFHHEFGVVAAKCSDYSGGSRQKRKLEKNIRDELDFMDRAKHDNIVRVFGWTTWTFSMAIIMEYMPGGNLNELLEDKYADITPLLSLHLCSDIANGISYIHHEFVGHAKLVHSDIKAENILLTENLRCKISDFGSAQLSIYTGTKTKAHNSLSHKCNFTAMYSPPEYLANLSRKPNWSYDVYSFSIIIYEVLTRRRPISNDDMRDLYLSRVENGYRPPVEKEDRKQFLKQIPHPRDESIFEKLVCLMEQCWKADPLLRPKMNDVCEELSSLIMPGDQDELQKDCDAVKQVIDITYFCKEDHDLAQIHEFSPPAFTKIDTQRNSTGSQSHQSFSNEEISAQNPHSAESDNRQQNMPSYVSPAGGSPGKFSNNSPILDENVKNTEAANKIHPSPQPVPQPQSDVKSYKMKKEEHAPLVDQLKSQLNENYNGDPSKVDTDDIYSKVESSPTPDPFLENKLPTSRPTPDPFLENKLPTSRPTPDPFLENRLPTSRPTPDPFLENKLPISRPTPDPFLENKFPTSRPTPDPFLENKFPTSRPTPDPFLENKFPTSRPTPDPFLENKFPTSRLTPDPFLENKLPTSRPTPDPFLENKFPTSRPTPDPFLENKLPTSRPTPDPFLENKLPTSRPTPYPFLENKLPTSRPTPDPFLENTLPTSSLTININQLGKKKELSLEGDSIAFEETKDRNLIDCSPKPPPDNLGVGLHDLVTVGFLVFNYDNLLCYDVQSKDLYPLPNLKTESHGGSISKLKDECYVIGGGQCVTVNNQTYGIGKSVKKLTLNPIDSSWKKVEPMSFARKNSISCACSDSIYVIGEANDDPNSQSSGERYCPRKNAWSPVAKTNHIRTMHAVAALKGKIYVIGGKGLDSAERYDEAVDSWTLVSAMSSKRTGVAATVIRERLYAIGGWNEEDGVLASVERFDPECGNWTKVASMNVPRCFHTAGVADGKLYVAGGFQSSNRQDPISTVEVYDVDRDHWTPFDSRVELQGQLFFLSL